MSTNYITRIKNNQITDSTITSAKLAPNTLTGGVFATNLTLNSNVTILGNLSVAGNTASINSINTYINDPAIIFNNGYSGSLTGYDIGFIVNRNLSTLAGYGAVNTAWVWDENQAAFLAIATSTSTTANNIVTVTNSGFANVQLGNLKANSLTVTTGTITATTGGIQNTPIGSATASTGAFTTLTATTSNPITLNATSGNITTLSAPNFSTGNAVITGAQTYIGSTGTPIANVQATLGTITTLYTTTEYATNFSTANAVITGGYATGLANVYATTAYATNFSSGNVYNISGSAGTLVATNFSSGNVVLTGGYATGLANVYATTAQATNFSSGNVVLTGGYATGLANVYATTAQATNFSSGNVLITGGSLSGITNLNVTTETATNFASGNARITGGYADNFPIGANNSSTGSFTTLFTSGIFTACSTVLASSGAASTSTSTGALQVQGGAGISGAVYAGSIQNTPIGSTTASTGAFTTITSSGTSIHYGNVVAASGTASTNTTTGALVVVGGIGASGALNVGSTLSASGVVTFTNATQNTGPSTGALQVSGGAYISGNLYVGGNINATVSAVSSTFGTFYGNTAGDGALYAGIVSGYLTEPLAIFQSTSNQNNYAGVLNGQNINKGALASTDIFLSPDNGTYNDTYLDMGIASSVYNYPGYSLIAPNDAYLFNWGNATTAGGNLIIGTGAVNDIIFAVQGINTNNEVMRITRANVVAIKSTVTATSTTSGALTVAGGAGISGAAFVGGNLVAASGTASTNTTTGALVVTGGAGISGAVYAGSIVNTPISGSTGYFTTAQATNFSSANARIASGYADNFPIGANTAATGAFTTLTASSTSILNGNVVAASGTASTNACLLYTSDAADE